MVIKMDKQAPKVHKEHLKRKDKTQLPVEISNKHSSNNPNNKLKKKHPRHQLIFQQIYLDVR